MNFEMELLKSNNSELASQSRMSKIEETIEFLNLNVKENHLKSSIRTHEKFVWRLSVELLKIS